jgi:hypothetical protein
MSGTGGEGGAATEGEVRRQPKGPRKEMRGVVLGPLTVDRFGSAE